MLPPPQLLFVYNADTGFFNLLADIGHKIMSPATYPCHLCALTHGVFKVRPTWQAFLENAPRSMVFLHRDEFLTQYPILNGAVLPAIFKP